MRLPLTATEESNELQEFLQALTRCTGQTTMDTSYLVRDRNASTEYETARRSAMRRELGAAIMRRRRSLLSLEEATADVVIHGQRYLGMRQVSVHDIVSSVGRSREFDSDFGPRCAHTRERWIKVADAYLRGINLPPVHLLKIGEKYVVTDGNHRVSVARHFGVEYIDAAVVEYVTCAARWQAAASGRHEAVMKSRYRFWGRSLLGQRS
jgi:hypothetical protein